MESCNGANLNIYIDYNISKTTKLEFILTTMNQIRLGTVFVISEEKRSQRKKKIQKRNLLQWIAYKWTASIIQISSGIAGNKGKNKKNK